MKIKRSAALAIFLAAVLLLLTGCADIQRFFAPSYDVVYYVDDIELSRQSIKETEFPVDPQLPDTPGRCFCHWADASGAKAQPAAVAVMGETEYHAVLLPELAEHSLYLFADDRGFIRPEAAMTADELSAALDALGSDQAKVYYPVLPAGEEPVTADLLREVLRSFYTEDVLDTAMSDVVDAPQITRGEFAVLMNSLLDRAAPNDIAAAKGEFAFPDMPADSQYYADVCEAAISHEHSGSGSWADAKLEPMFAEGFLPMDGWLYYVDAEGRFVMDADVGSHHFGPDGRYTSGDEALDALVQPVLARLQADDTTTDRLEKLKEAYYYCRDTFQYLRRNYYNMGDIGWEWQEAKTMLETGRGNCYNYASAFWALSRALGYEPRTVSGTITVTNQPHGWVIIPIDGQEYYFDPEMEMTYIRDKRPVKNMFMMHPYYAAGWTYRGA